jgi:hypothetical protein
MAEKMVMQINLIFLNGDVSKYHISNSDAQRSVAAKVGNFGGIETSSPVKLKTCGFETTKTTPAS